MLEKLSNAPGHALLALTFFTRLPLTRSASQHIGEDQNLGHATAWFPVAGLIIGLSAASIMALAALVLPIGIAAGLALAATLILTGALHEDGLADTADAWGAGGERTRALEIMRDSRIGTYGTLALILAIGLKWTALSNLDVTTGGLALISVHTLSRAAILVPIHISQYARTGGLGSLVNTAPGTASLAVATGIAVLVALIACGLAGLAVLVLTLAIAWVMTLAVGRWIGGYTGDTLGATQQLCETAGLVMLAAFLA